MKPRRPRRHALMLATSAQPPQRAPLALQALPECVAGCEKAYSTLQARAALLGLALRAHGSAERPVFEIERIDETGPRLSVRLVGALANVESLLEFLEGDVAYGDTT